MNRHKEKGNSILNRQKDYQRKDKFMLGNGKFSLKMLCHFNMRIMHLCLSTDFLEKENEIKIDKHYLP